MSLDFNQLTQLRKKHPAWRLLQAEHAPLIASFLYQAFIQPNERVMSQTDLVSKLEDLLFQLREEEEENKFPRDAQTYLDEWSKSDKGWLRKFYPTGSDDPHFDLTPATEKALSWLENLAEKQFVGTESRLLTVFELLRQMVNGAETDPKARIAELEQRKADLDKQIKAIEKGDIPLMDQTALRDRFLQVSSTARELLSDFRAVEHNFRELDQALREKIASWDGRKGELLQKIFGERDAISDSDQGRSFRAFWDFLMSPASQEELTHLLEQVFAMQALGPVAHDKRLKRIHFDWLEAGEYTQRTVAKLSEQLRRYLDNQAYLENKRIIQLLNNINANALLAKQELPKDAFMTLDDPAPTIYLPMEKPLYTPVIKIAIRDKVLSGEAVNFVPEALFNQIVVDKKQLLLNINKARGHQEQITLKHVIAQFPLRHGLAELIGYLSIAASLKQALFDENYSEEITWKNQEGKIKRTHLPRIIYPRGSSK